MQPTAVQEEAQAAGTPRATAANAEDIKDEAREARETLKKEWDEAIRKTKPKDTAAGLKSGVATAAAGVASGLVGLFAAPIVGAKQEGASGFAKGLATGKQGCAVVPVGGVSICSACAGLWGPYKLAEATTTAWLKGYIGAASAEVTQHCACVCFCPAGIAGVVVLPVAGVVGGAVQVGRGIANQSEATREKKAGKIWNKVGSDDLLTSTPANGLSSVHPACSSQPLERREEPCEYC
jgi:hypothetical protein